MKKLALAAISFYQRYLSPRKGFVCAFRFHTGRDGCSAYGKRVIERHGLRVGLVLLGRRLDACKAVHRRHRPAPARLPAYRRAQAGFCDCDIPDLPCSADDACKVLDCASGCYDVRDLWRKARGQHE